MHLQCDIISNISQYITDNMIPLAIYHIMISQYVTDNMISLTIYHNISLTI